MKILITIGTLAEKKFTRFFRIIDELCEEGVLDGENVVAQIGSDTYTPKHYKSFKMVDSDIFEQIIREADFVITHGGAGTITNCLKAGKKTIVFPRQAKFDEHFDDHQLQLSAIFTDKKYVLSARNKKELRECIQSISDFTPVPFQSSNHSINQLIIDKIEKDRVKNFRFYRRMKSLLFKRT